VLFGLSELCLTPLDLVIVIDKSEYWTGQFARLREGVSTLVTRLFVGADMTHVAVVSYSANATLHFNLVQYFQTGPMQNAIRAIQQDYSGTATDLVSHPTHRSTESYKSFFQYPRAIYSVFCWDRLYIF